MNHEHFMETAINEALKGEGKVSPNPIVGSLLVFNGEIIAQGYHGEMGLLHAERVVFEKLKQKNFPQEKIKQSTLYITLEPCCHHGKTPPCTDAILESGIQEVVIAQQDPNPLMSGKGINILKKAGIEVIKGVLEKEAQYITRFFRHWIEKQEPYFLGKLAMSSDGFYAQEGKNIAISSPQTKTYTRSLRKIFDAILVGKKTLLQDNPHIGCEEKESPLLRVILCQKADFSTKNLQAFRDENVIIACKEKSKKCDFQGVFLFYKDLTELKKQLFQIGIQSVLIEGGGEVLQLFLQEKLIQELMIVESKKKKLLNGKSLPNIPQEFKLQREEDLGEDTIHYYT